MENWILFCAIAGLVIILLMLAIGILEFVTWRRLKTMKREYGESITTSYRENGDGRPAILREDSLRTYFEHNKERGEERKNVSGKETAEKNREETENDGKADSTAQEEETGSDERGVCGQEGPSAG